jgi:hypothetical protein
VLKPGHLRGATIGIRRDARLVSCRASPSQIQSAAPSLISLMVDSAGTGTGLNVSGKCRHNCWHELSR